MTAKHIKTLVKQLGFESLGKFKEYMKGKAKLNEWGAVCYEEERELNGSKIELDYSHNCKNKFGLGFIYNGMFIAERF